MSFCSTGQYDFIWAAAPETFCLILQAAVVLVLARTMLQTVPQDGLAADNHGRNSLLLLQPFRMLKTAVHVYRAQGLVAAVLS